MAPCTCWGGVPWGWYALSQRQEACACWERPAWSSCLGGGGGQGEGGGCTAPCLLTYILHLHNSYFFSSSPPVAPREFRVPGEVMWDA